MVSRVCGIISGVEAIVTGPLSSAREIIEESDESENLDESEEPESSLEEESEALADTEISEKPESDTTASDEQTEDEDDIDPFEALNVSTTAPAARGASLLEAFAEDDDDKDES